MHIKGASTGFYLAMSESYHDQWQLQMNNKKINDQHFAQGHFLWSIKWIFMGRFVDLDICNRGAGDMHGAGTVETRRGASVH